MDEAADQLVETDSSAVTTKSIARITTQPLARYGKPRFTHLNRPSRVYIRPPTFDRASGLEHTLDLDEAHRFPLWRSSGSA